MARSPTRFNPSLCRGADSPGPSLRLSGQYDDRGPGLGKLRKLRHWVKRFRWIGDTLQKVFAPHLAKALTFLDDKLLPATSHAVERGNRRYRKMQKHVYRVRTQGQISARLALDMWREAHAEGRQQTLTALHRARAG